MNVEVQADYALRGRDYDTELVGPITDDIIDAARLCRVEYENGFPGFPIYRLLLCGDLGYLVPVRQWWVLFSIEWCRRNMRDAFSEELATVAAWDSLQRTMDPVRPILSATETAESLGVDKEQYIRARRALHGILGSVLKHYWTAIGAMYRIVVAANRKF